MSLLSNSTIAAGCLVLCVGMGAVLGGCGTIVPVYLRTSLDGEVADSITTNRADSVQVTVASQVKVTKFTPFDHAYNRGQSGALGVQIPIQDVLGALVEDYATQKFDRLQGVTRLPPEEFGAGEESPVDSMLALELGSEERIDVMITLFDFRIKEFFLPSSPDSIALLAGQGSGAVGGISFSAAPSDTVDGAMSAQLGSDTEGVGRGARMIASVVVRHGTSEQRTALHASAERHFRSPVHADWRSVVNDVTSTILQKLDRYLESQGL